MSKKQHSQSKKEVVATTEEPKLEVEVGAASSLEDAVSKTSINKYDPFQIKSSLDEEIAYVSAFLVEAKICGLAS